MSFLSERKDEIIKTKYNRCCMRALLNGVLFSKASAKKSVISFNLENFKIAEYISSIVFDLFQKNASVSRPISGGRCLTVSFNSSACERYLREITEKTNTFLIEKCEFCKSAFIKGVFLSCGRVSEPAKGYRLELSPAFRTEKLLNFFKENNLNFSFQKRRKENILYISNSTAIEEFFTHAGMNTTTFLMMNSKIENGFKNMANRIRNCETHNIGKSISASAKFVDAIEALEKANLLSTLPEELEKTARLRIKYRDYSLARLTGEFSPPISKPGLSHRLNKILEIHDSLLKDKK